MISFASHVYFSLPNQNSVNQHSFSICFFGLVLVAVYKRPWNRVVPWNGRNSKGSQTGASLNVS